MGAAALNLAAAEEAHMTDEHKGKRRLIGIDLAWGKQAGTDYGSTDCEGSGCAELVWDGDELRLSRLDLLHSMAQIVEWIEPKCGDWVVAVDAPLVICNEEGQRPAENQASKLYGRYDAGAHSTNLKRKHRGPQLLGALADEGGELVEQVAAAGGRKLVFETYPHPATIELFDLNLIIKYKRKKGMSPEQRRVRQQELADRIRTHFCDRPIGPTLRRDDCLTNLLSEPDPKVTHKELKEREDKLDGLICAYVAAWADAGRCLQRFGEDGEGVMLIPCLRPCVRSSPR